MIVPDANEPDKTGHLKKAKQRAFLAVYESSANVSKAAQLAGIGRSSHYEWMKSDPDYVEAFNAVREIAGDALEDEAIRRAHEGVGEPVVYQGQLSYLPVIDPISGEIARDDKGNIRYTGTPLTIQKYSDTLLIFLLKGSKPDKYRDNFKGEMGFKGINITISPDDERL